VTLGFLNKNPRSKSLRLGPKALMLGHTCIQGFELLYMAKPLIDKVHRDFNITIDSALLDGMTLLALYRREAPNTLFFRQPLASGDLHARAMGKAVLSRMSEEELDRYIKQAPYKRLTPATITQVDDLLRDLDDTRKRGYSLNKQEYMQGLTCIGAPVVNFSTGRVVGAISFDFPAGDEIVEVMERNYARPLLKLAHDLSETVTRAEY